MKREHEDLILEMAVGMDDGGAGGAVKCRQVIDGLQAAAERGYVLAKIPERKRQPTAQSEDRIAGWNRCLDAIETIDLEESDGS